MLKCFTTACLLALLPMSTLAAPVIDVTSASGDYTSSENWGEFLSFDASATGQGFGIAGDLFADLQLSFNLAAPYSDANGLFTLTSGGIVVLDGMLSAIIPENSGLSLMFTDIGGDLASIFGDALMVELTFFEAFGDDPLTMLAAGNSYEFAYTVEGKSQPAPVPLPAGSLLLFSSLGLLALRQRRKPAL